VPIEAAKISQAFANALNSGSHIRVSILLNSVPDAWRRWLEIWCFGIGAVVIWYFCFCAYRFVYQSRKFNDVSQWLHRTLLRIPQSAMLLGAVMLAIALTGHLLHVIFRGNHRITGDLTDQSHADQVQWKTSLSSFCFYLFCCPCWAAASGLVWP
jgi:TRAP-type C4-dicarboxylate transport system permease small subunit